MSTSDISPGHGKPSSNSHGSPRDGSWVFLALSVLGSAIAYACVFRLDALAHFGQLRNLLATAAATLPFALLILRLPRISLSPKSQLLWIFGGLVLLRLAVPLNLLEGSDDAYRYLWDGKVHASGINPYLHAPQAAELAHLRDAAIYPKIFRPDMRTVYPPLAELMFLLAYLIGGLRVIGLKLVFLLHELASAWLLIKLAHRGGHAPNTASLYIFSPLVVVQGFSGGHLDIMLTPWILATLWLAEERPFLAGVSLGCSAMVRPLTALGGPALALRRPWRETFAMGVGFMVSTGLFTVPYAWGAKTRMLESLGAYAQHWQFNGSIFKLLHPHLHEWDYFRPALYLAIALGALAVGFFRGPRWAKLAVSLGLYFALAPTVYPWYLLPMVALLAVGQKRLFAAALPLLISLSDLVFITGTVGGDWSVPPWALAVEYAGLYGLTAMALRPHNSSW